MWWLIGIGHQTLRQKSWGRIQHILQWSQGAAGSLCNTVINLWVNIEGNLPIRQTNIINKWTLNRTNFFHKCLRNVYIATRKAKYVNISNIFYNNNCFFTYFLKMPPCGYSCTKLLNRVSTSPEIASLNKPFKNLDNWLFNNTGIIDLWYMLKLYIRLDWF